MSDAELYQRCREVRDPATLRRECSVILGAIWRKVAETWDIHAQQFQVVCEEAWRSGHTECADEFRLKAAVARTNKRLAIEKAMAFERGAK